MAETTELGTARLWLEPLRVAHAGEMTVVLNDSSLYEFTGGHPPTGEELIERYQYQIAGPGRANEQWHNWIVRRVDTGEVIGFVQATVIDGVADLAWLIATPHQRQGYAVEASQTMVAWLASQGVGVFSAHIDPVHVGSAGVAAAIGLHGTGATDEAGEEIWRT